MEHVVADGGVVTVHWQAIETDGAYNARTYSSMNFTYDASAPDFVPYADLTEAEVIHRMLDQHLVGVAQRAKEQVPVGH